MPTIEVMEILATTMRELADIAGERGNPFDSSYGEIASRLQFPPAVTTASLIKIREGGLMRVNPITSPRALHAERRFRLDFNEEGISRLSETLASRWYNFACPRGSEWQIVNTPLATRRERERQREERELEDRADGERGHRLQAGCRSVSGVSWRRRRSPRRCSPVGLVRVGGTRPHASRGLYRAVR